MKTVVLTGYDDPYAAIGDLTRPLIEEYASIHEFDFQKLDLNRMDRHPSWGKIWATLEFLKSGYRVMWIDADQVITNRHLAFLPESGFHASLDWGFDAKHISNFNCGCYTACPDSLPIFGRVWEERDLHKSNPFWEQDSMREEWIRRNGHGMTIHRPSRFNAVPQTIAPGMIREPWQPGDFACHLTMVDVAMKARLFYEFRAQAIP